MLLAAIEAFILVAFLQVIFKEEWSFKQVFGGALASAIINNFLVKLLGKAIDNPFALLFTDCFIIFIISFIIFNAILQTDVKRAACAAGGFIGLHFGIVIIILLAFGGMINSMADAADDFENGTNEMVFYEDNGNEIPPIEDQGPAGSYLGGFQITEGEFGITSLQAVFINAKSEYSKGKIFGKVVGDKKEKSFKKGYAVSSIEYKQSEGILWAVRLGYNKIKEDGSPDPDDKFQSEWLGSKDHPDKPQTIFAQKGFISKYKVIHSPEEEAVVLMK